MATEEVWNFEELEKVLDKNVAKLDENTIALWEELILPIKAMESEAALAQNATREINRLKNLKWGKWIWFILITMLIGISNTTATEIMYLVDSMAVGSIIFWGLLVLGMVAIFFAKKKYIQLKVEKQEEIYHTHIENLNKMKSRISDKLSRIPQEYWNSYALDFMVKQYRSGRVDTVKEARIAYDRHCHELRMERNQEEIIRQNNQLIRNQESLGNQMKRDTDDIILSMFLR